MKTAKNQSPLLASRIRVKVLSRVPEELWLRHFPAEKPSWNNCDFIFDPEAREYDWLVVYDDLPASKGERFTSREEHLACPKNNTMLMTTEPPSIKAYGTAFTAQFGHVLTSQEPWALPHPQRIYTQPALHWYYGIGSSQLRSYDQMANHPPLVKSHDLSTVCSAKQQRNTLHNRRYNFTQELKKLLPDMDVFGRGVRPMDDKADALDDYRYHIAIENHIGLHHWTEKLSDAFLGATLPFYCGCPNAADYFPEESFIPIDIKDVSGCMEIISRAIHNKEYEKRLPAILEARRLVLEQYNFFAVIAREVEARVVNPGELPAAGSIKSRKLIRKSHPLVAVQYLYEKYRSRILCVLKAS